MVVSFKFYPDVMNLYCKQIILIIKNIEGQKKKRTFVLSFISLNKTNEEEETHLHWF